MFMFKRVSLIFLCLVLAISTFAACDKGSDSTDETSAQTSEQTSEQTSSDTSSEAVETTSGETESESENSGITEVEWDAMILASKFDNVTFTSNATFISGYEDKGPHTNVFKLNGSAGTVDGELMSGESLTATRNMTIGTALAIVNDFDKFEYNKADDSYVSTEAIVYNVSVMNYNAKITAKNVVVELDDDMNITKIACNMTQEFEDDGVAKTYVLDITFIFSDYGNTVVDAESMSREQWALMLADSNFENYTLTQSQYGVYEGTGMQQDTIFKSVADKAFVSITVDGALLQELTYTGEEAIAQKNSYKLLFQAMIEEYDNFSYDKVSNTYKNTTEFSVNIPMDVYNASLSMTVKDIAVTVGEDQKMQKIECSYIQNTLTPEGVARTDITGTWLFSDYGTTVIE